MAVDRRESAGDFYPGGKVIATRPVATGGDVRHSEFASIEEVPERFTDTTMRDKLNEVIGALRGASAAVALFFALAASGAGVTVQTAQKGQVYNDEQIVTNVTFDASGLATAQDLADATNGLLRTETDPTVPEWAKSQTQPLPPDYAAVSNLAYGAATKADATLTELTGFTPWTVFRDGVDITSRVPQPEFHSEEFAPGVNWDFWVVEGLEINTQVFGGINDTSLSCNMSEGEYSAHYNAIRFPLSGYQLGSDTNHILAAQSELSALAAEVPRVAQAATNYTDAATNALAQSSASAFMPASFTESDPTISSWAKAAQKPTYTAAEVGATTAEDVYRLVAGTNVVLVVTNYNSLTKAPAMKLQHLDPESGEYVTYWDETRRHGITLTNAMEYTDAAILTRAPRAWSGTTSGLGAEAPAGVTWISTPETVIAGGYEYEKVVTSAGAVWVLSSNGLSTGATTNSYFRVAASDGTELFSIEKTDSYLIGVNPDGITKSGNTVTIPVNVVGAQHPYIRAATNLVNAVWTKEDENGFTCPWASVSWSGSTGAYVATVTCAEPAAFFYFEYLQEGVAKIKNSAKTDLTGGIVFNGTTYMPTVNGSKLEFVAQ